MLATAGIVEALRDGSGAFLHGHTYLAHPTACAAALAVQQVIRRDGLLEQVRARGALLEQRLQERLGNHRHIGDIRGRGLFLGIELVADRPGKTPFDPALKLHARIKQAALARGMACYPGGGTIDGVHGDHVVLAPPYIVTPAEVDLIVDRLGDAIEDALSSLR